MELRRWFQTVMVKVRRGQQKRRTGWLYQRCEPRLYITQLEQRRVLSASPVDQDLTNFTVAGAMSDACFGSTSLTFEQTTLPLTDPTPCAVHDPAGPSGDGALGKVASSDEAAVQGTQAYLSEGDLIVEALGENSSNDVTLRLVRKDGEEYLQISDPSSSLSAGAGVFQVDAHTLWVPTADLTGNTTVIGNNGDNTLTIDLSGGNPISEIGLVFCAGEGRDNLNVLANGEDAAFFLGRTAGQGMITAGGRTIHFTGVESDTVTLAEAATVTMNLTEGDTVQFSQVSASRSRAAGLSNAVEFDSPTQQLVVNVLDDNDYALHLNSLAADFNPLDGIEINGGNGAETVIIRNFGESFSAALAIDLGAGSDAVTFDGPDGNGHRYTSLMLHAETIAQINGGTLTVTGPTILDNQGAVLALTLDDPGNDFGSIRVTALNSPVRLRDKNLLEIAAATIGGPLDTTSTGLLITGPVYAVGVTFRASTGTISGNLSAGSSTIHLLSGTFHLDGGDRIDNDSTLNIGADAALAIGGNHETVRTLIIDGGSITGTTGVLTSIDAIEGRSGSVAAILAGSNGLNKTTEGTLILTGPNTFTGQTTVNEGVLLVNGVTATGSAVSVRNGATLGGNGIVGGTVSVADGGTVAPGASSGILQTGSVTFASGSAFDVQINGKNVGSEYDRLGVSGAVSLESATLDVSLAFTPDFGDVFSIILNNGSDGVYGTFAGLPEGRVFTVTTGEHTATFQITYQGGDGNDVVLTTIDPSAPVFQGTPVNDHFLVMRHGTDVQVYLNGTLIDSRDIASITGGLTLNGGAGDDTLLIDYEGGDPVPVAGLSFNGGPGNDAMAIRGTGMESGVYQPGNVAGNDGKKATVQIGASSIRFDGLEPLDITAFASFAIDPAGADDDLTIADGFNLTTAIAPAIGTQSAMLISGTTGGWPIETVALWNVGTVKIDTAQTVDGRDTITIASGNSAHGITDLIIDTGSSDDVVNVIGALTVAGTIQVSSQNIQFTANGTLKAGATGSATLDAGAGTISRTSDNNLVHITAQSLSLSAAHGIGGPGRPIHTQVESLQANVAGTGSIYLEDQSGGLTLTGMSAHYGSIKVLAQNGTLTVAGAVTATDGDLLLSAPGGDLAVQAAVTADGNASLLASQGIEQAAVAVTAGGTLDVHAANGSITMADGATGTATGNVRFLAAQDATLGGVSGANVRIEATSGSILDGGDQHPDVTAGTAQLAAGVSVGAPGAGAIDTSVGTLAASAGTGSIYVSEADGLIIGSVSAITVNRVQMDSTSPPLSGDALSGAVAAEHVKIASGVHAAGELTINSLVTATSADVLLHSTEGDLVVNAAVTAGGSASLLASQGIEQAAVAVTAGGTLDVHAAGGSITMADGATATATGNVRFLAAQDVTLGGVSGANVRIEATSGSILDGGDQHPAVTAGTAQLAAGVSVGAPGAGAIDTSVGTLAASAGTGSIYVSEADGLIIGSVSAITVNRVQMDSTSPSQPGVALSGAMAAEHVKVESGVNAAGQLTINSLVAATSADVLLHSTEGDLVVNAAVTADGNASLLASQGIEQAAVAVTAGGTLDVHAAGGSITMADGATATATGNVRFLAAQDVTLGGVSGANVRIEATSGSILDGGDQHPAVTAGTAQLAAGVSVGAPGAGAIDTSVGTLAASAGTGSIYVSEADGLIIGSVSAITVNRVQMDSTSPSQPGVALSGAMAAEHVKVESGVNAAGQLTINSLVAATSADVLLHSTEGDLVVNAAVTAGGSASLLASQGIEQAAVAVTAGGTLDVYAAGGSITMADGATAMATGNVRFLAAQDVTLGGVSGANVRIEATSGSILDGGDQHPAVTAGTAQLAAGVSVGAPGAGAIDTSVGTLAASAGTGSIYVSEADGLIIGSVSAITVNRVQMDSTSPSQPGIALSGAMAAEHVKVESGVNAAGQLTINSLVAATSADVLLHSTEGDLVVNAAVTAGGSASLLASQGIEQAAVAVTAGGTLDVYAAGGSITMADGATAMATGNVRFLAAQDVTLGGVSGANVRIEATSGSILDGGDQHPAVTAGTAQLAAGVSVGAPGAGAIDTSVGTLAASAGTGSIYVSEADGLIIGSVSAIDVLRVRMSSSSEMQAGALLEGVRGADRVEIQALVDLTVDSPVMATTGDVLLRTLGGDLTISATVNSGSDDIRLQSARDIVVQALVQAGKDMTLLADSSDDGQGGLWVQASGKLAASGDITARGSDVFRTIASEADRTAEVQVVVGSEGAEDGVRVDANDDHADADQMVATGRIMLGTHHMGNLVLRGVIRTSGTRPLDLDASGSILLGSSLATNGGRITLLRPTLLIGDALLITNATTELTYNHGTPDRSLDGDVWWAAGATIDSQFGQSWGLTLHSGTGATTFNANIGETTALASLVVAHTAGPVTFGGADLASVDAAPVTLVRTQGDIDVGAGDAGYGRGEWRDFPERRTGAICDVDLPYAGWGKRAFQRTGDAVQRRGRDNQRRRRRRDGADAAGGYHLHRCSVDQQSGGRAQQPDIACWHRDHPLRRKPRSDGDLTEPDGPGHNGRSDLWDLRCGGCRQRHRTCNAGSDPRGSDTGRRNLRPCRNQRRDRIQWRRASGSTVGSHD
jgi:autotransporter-associated beta strand protein